MTGFQWCLLSTVTIESYLCVYSFQEQVESLLQDEPKEHVFRMLEYQLGLIMTWLEKGDPGKGLPS